MADLRVTILTDDPDSWIWPVADQLAAELDAVRVFTCADVAEGDILVALGCLSVIPAEVLARNRSNVVVHPSPLPRGRGFSPMAGQVLAGESEIPVTLFEAAHPVDTGPVYLVETIRLDGSELNDEIKRLQGDATVRLVRRYVAGFPMPGIPQSGPASWYRRRTPDDSRLDPDRSIAEQFDLLRVVDNDRYPAFFEIRGRRYRLRIERDDP